MSAYDNPTIIRDDSAMAWAQAFGSAGQAFTESFNVARKEREAKEKEKKLEDERKAKADKEQSIKDQTLISDFEYKEQENTLKGAEDLQKLGASSDALSLRNNFRISTSKIVGKNNLEISKNVLSKEVLDEKNKYSSDVATTNANLDKALGAVFSQTSEFRDGKINRGDISNYVFNGDDLLTQGIGKAVFFGFTFPKSSNITKDLEYDVNKPADARLNVQIPLNNIEELTEVFLAANATALPEEIDEAIKTGITNGSIIPEGAVGKEKYTIKYNPKISEFTGEFYTKIPEIGLGDTSTTVGIYSKENDNKINNNYLKPTQLADIEGNLLLPGSAGTAKYQRTEVDAEAVRASMRPTLQAKAAGLISAYFSDNASANGILRKLGFGTDYPLKKFNETYKGETAQVNALVQKMEEEEWKNISTKSDLKEIGGKYYIMDSESYQMFNKPSKAKGGGKPGTSKETWEEKETAIKSVASISGTHRWGSNSVYTDGAGNWYENRNMDAPLNSQEEALAYLRTGKKSSKKSGKK
jgi:hypothetical protein